jgi:hypothetical protein
MGEQHRPNILVTETATPGTSPHPGTLPKTNKAQLTEHFAFLSSIDELEITCSISSVPQPTISTLGPSRSSSINHINCSKEHLRRATVHATPQSKRSSRAPALLTPRCFYSTWLVWARLQHRLLIHSRRKAQDVRSSSSVLLRDETRGLFVSKTKSYQRLFAATMNDLPEAPISSESSGLPLAVATMLALIESGTKLRAVCMAQLFQPTIF